MTIATYDDLMQEMQQLYQNEQYAEALRLLTEEGHRFPEQGQTIYYLRSCMAARTQQTDLALNLLEEALDRGFWYGEQVMRQTPSWQGLQGHAEFERLAERNIAKQAEARSGPRLFTLEPEGGCPVEQPCPLLIALHGNGDNARNALNAWRSATSQGWLLAAMQSSQTLSSDAYVWEDQEAALRDLAEHYATLQEQHAIDKERVIVAGFSMGGDTALRAALTNTIPVKGFILLGPGGPTTDDPETWPTLIKHAQTVGLKGYVITAEQDPVVQYGAIEKLVDTLNAHNVPCHLETLTETRHQYPPDFAPMLDRALAFIEQ